METVVVSADRRPNAKEREKYLKFMKTENIGKMVMRIKDGDKTEEVVLELIQKDAEGRELLQD